MSIQVMSSLQGAGMNLRGPIVAMYQFPTIVIFCEGQGIATAKALLETGPAEGGLNFPYREDVRMYYRVCLQVHHMHSVESTSQLHDNLHSCLAQRTPRFISSSPGCCVYGDCQVWSGPL